jgi:hypothetical protein
MFHPLCAPTAAKGFAHSDCRSSDSATPGPPAAAEGATALMLPSLGRRYPAGLHSCRFEMALHTLFSAHAVQNMAKELLVL